MRNRSTAVLLAIFVFMPLTSLHAQSSASASGISVTAGAGGAWVRVSCDVCQTARDLGPSAFVRVGKAMHAGVRVAAELTAWTHEVEDERENLGAAMAVLQIYPNDSPLYLKAGLGYLGYRAGEAIALNTVGMQLGAGYELRLGGLALSNQLTLMGSAFGSLKSEGTTIADDVGTTLLQIGVGLTVR
jgi:hypothetical protein